jgi:hypothetical protein
MVNSTSRDVERDDLSHVIIRYSALWRCHVECGDERVVAQRRRDGSSPWSIFDGARFRERCASQLDEQPLSAVSEVLVSDGNVAPFVKTQSIANS